MFTNFEILYNLMVLGFKLNDYLIIALDELLSGDLLEIICPDHPGSDNPDSVQLAMPLDTKARITANTVTCLP